MRKLFIIFTIAFVIIWCQMTTQILHIIRWSFEIELPTETSQRSRPFTSFEFEGTTLSVTCGQITNYILKQMVK